MTVVKGKGHGERRLVMETVVMETVVMETIQRFLKKIKIKGIYSKKN